MDLQGYLDRIELFDYLLIALNLLLLVLAKRILLFFREEESDKSTFILKVQAFRALNLLIILSYGYSNIYLETIDSGPGLKLVSIWVLIYLSYLTKQILSYWVRKKYGKLRDINGESKSIETYTSRLLSLLTGVVIFVIALISIINVLEFNSLLQAGGVIGIIGVFLALTQNAWAPDIISGLIFLNNGMIEEGDVIELDDNGSFIGVVFKTKMFHTEVLNLVNNHRVMIKNARLREFTIHNLSKFASAKGLREQLTFKIGYDVTAEKVRQMFSEAEKRLESDCGIKLGEENTFEIGILNTGDHAIEWGVYYFTKDVKALIKNRQAIRECILKTAQEFDISLATPITHVNMA
ncbi:MAG: small-conductance mechanosensitive channel-like protein [endosymbiont of Galathealinum brachiosum]|uniref:Small-conductance mechanosensitive channel n=1 Tax=endosymbiont of Galathealinum brachiosum TaxID=2200906 RepID=A0A370DB52_9GAMM|nr:MAG: small-conductance mechanosensitive channel-like protein [endosymbiont of Galathealinum brachiosum]